MRVFMQRFYLRIKRRRTGVSPETFQLSLIGLSATAFILLIKKFFNHDNPKSQYHIYGGGS
nr:MAG TPA: hypothetical protein [Caudoviricetes sp.]